VTEDQVIERADVDRLGGAPVLSSEGAAVGQVSRLYPRGDTDRPDYVLVDHPREDVGPVAVPLQDARFDDGTLHVAFTEDELAGAPFFDAGEELDSADAAALESYYEDLRRGRDEGLTSESVPLPPRGQEKVTPSEGPGDVPPGRPTGS
jgi:hypothetical protein